MDFKLKGHTISKFNSPLLFCCALTFVVFYLVLSFYNRAASDDIHSIVLYRKLGTVDLLLQFFNSWSGRWTTILYFCSLLQFADPLQNFHFYVFAYYLVTLVILLFSIQSIIRSMIRKVLKVESDRITTFTFASVFLGSFYFFTFQATEVWWWICSSYVYLQGIVALLAGTALLLKENKKSFHHVLIAICFIYLGGSSEVYVLIIGTLLILFFLLFKYLLRQQFSSFVRGPYFKACLIAILSFLVSALICLSAPGNRNRMKNDFQANAMHTFSQDGPERKPQQILDFTKKYPFALAISSLWFFFGLKLKNVRNEDTVSKHGRIWIYFLAMALVVSLLIVWIFQSLVLNDVLLPARAWTFSSFLLSVFFCSLFFLMGYRSVASGVRIHILSVLLPSLVFGLMLINLSNQFSFASNYSAEYDSLISTLQKNKNNLNKDTLFVKLLPDPGMLVALDLKDPKIREGLEEIMGLPYKLKQ